MAVPKSTSVEAVKGRYVCGECELEFKGSSCPECGNKKGNKRVAEDGITQEDHRVKFIQPLRPLLDEFGDPLSEDDLMNLQYSKMAQQEFQENLRTSRLNMSEIKKLESEKKLAIKRSELARLKEGIIDSYPPPSGSHAQPEMPQGPMFGTQSPQSLFLSQLMRMSGDDRAEFMAQLVDADPNALAMLNSMVTPQNQNPMMGFQNPMSMYPPYFSPPVQQEKQPAESPIFMMKEMMGLMKEMQPANDNSARDLVNELKNELKSLHSRIDNVIQDKTGRDPGSDPILQHLKALEYKVDAAQQQPTFTEQLRGIKSMVDDIKEMGLINTSNAGTSITDQMELRKLDHQIDMEKKKFNIDIEHLDVERSNQKTKEKLVQQLFSRGLTKPEIPEVIENQVKPFGRSIGQTFRPIPAPESIEIVEEINTDTGSIREVRRTDPIIPSKE